MRLIPILALLSALWAGPGRAVVTWEQPAGLHCLYRQPATGTRVLVRCFLEAGSYSMTFEAGDSAYHPMSGDIYVLRMPDGAIERATLGARPLYFPAFLH